MGLTNQLLTMANGINLGMRTNRTVCLVGFNSDIVAHSPTFHFINHEEWFLNVTEPVGRILDMGYLRERLRERLGSLAVCSVDVRAINGSTCIKKEGSLDGWCAVIRDRSLIPHHTHRWNVSLAEVSTKLTYEQAFSTGVAQYIDSAMIADPFQLYFQPHDHYITQSMRFRKCFYDIVHEYTSKLFGGQNYTAVHLRVEEDLTYRIDKLPVKYLFLHTLISEIQELVPSADTPILLCTGLGLKKDPLHFGVRYFKSVFPNSVMLPKLEMLRSCRYCGLRHHSMGSMLEVHAILDFIAMGNAQTFVGVGGHSSFSSFRYRFPHNVSEFKHISKTKFHDGYPAEVVDAFMNSSVYRTMQQMSRNHLSA
jgi:hypothetical protein